MCLFACLLQTPTVLVCLWTASCGPWHRQSWLWTWRTACCRGGTVLCSTRPTRRRTPRLVTLRRGTANRCSMATAPGKRVTRTTPHRLWRWPTLLRRAKGKVWSVCNSLASTISTGTVLLYDHCLHILPIYLWEVYFWLIPYTHNGNQKTKNVELLFLIILFLDHKANTKSVFNNMHVQYHHINVCNVNVQHLWELIATS